MSYRDLARYLESTPWLVEAMEMLVDTVVDSPRPSYYTYWGAEVSGVSDAAEDECIRLTEP